MLHEEPLHCENHYEGPYRRKLDNHVHLFGAQNHNQKSLAQLQTKRNKATLSTINYLSLSNDQHAYWRQMFPLLHATSQTVVCASGELLVPSAGDNGECQH